MRSSLLTLLALGAGALPAAAKVRLPALFSNHAVVQRAQPLHVWGWADPGEAVEISLGENRQSTKAGADGKWQVRLNPITDAGPHRLVAKGGQNEVVAEDVLAGEVWLCSGQSNMAFTVERAKDFPKEQPAAKFPLLRVFTVGAGHKDEPQAECRGQWQVCTPETVGRFTATGYFFGRRVHQVTQLPVGLINSSVGGTDIAAWTSLPAQKDVSAIQPLFQEWAEATQKFDAAAMKAKNDALVARYQEQVAAAQAAGQPVPKNKPRLAISPLEDKNRPAVLFNAMIAPLIPYNLRGAIWYQGEHNTYTIERAARYETQLRLLVKDWRQRWGSEFSFGWVQLPNFERSPEGRALVREATLKCLDLPKTGMAVTIDIGEATDNHPTNKQEVGFRLAQWALGAVYGLPEITSGPLLAGHQVEGNAIRIKFKHAEQGMRTLDNTSVSGFTIAGADRQWHPAQAAIQNQEVLVSSPEVPKPVAVRYGFTGNPKCTLYNAANLPASPFRTDDWPLTGP